jgi:hypothetical protein
VPGTRGERSVSGEGKPMKKIKYPIHKSGKNCGYDEFEDGSIRVADYYAIPMTEAMVSERAVRNLLESMTKQCHQLLIPIEKKYKDFWDVIKEDYGLDFEKYTYSFNYETKILSRKIKESRE